MSPTTTCTGSWRLAVTRATSGRWGTVSRFPKSEWSTKQPIAPRPFGLVSRRDRAQNRVHAVSALSIRLCVVAVGVLPCLFKLFFYICIASPFLQNLLCPISTKGPATVHTFGPPSDIVPPYKCVEFCDSISRLVNNELWAYNIVPPRDNTTLMLQMHFITQVAAPSSTRISLRPQMQMATSSLFGVVKCLKTVAFALCATKLSRANSMGWQPLGDIKPARGTLKLLNNIAILLGY